MKKIATLVLTLVLGFGFVGGFSGCKKEETKKTDTKTTTTDTKTTTPEKKADEKK